jgi:hypothetical protein
MKTCTQTCTQTLSQKAAVRAGRQTRKRANGHLQLTAALALQPLLLRSAARYICILHTYMRALLRLHSCRSYVALEIVKRSCTDQRMDFCAYPARYMMSSRSTFEVLIHAAYTLVCDACMLLIQGASKQGAAARKKKAALAAAARAASPIDAGE